MYRRDWLINKFKVLLIIIFGVFNFHYSLKEDTLDRLITKLYTNYVVYKRTIVYKTDTQICQLCLGL